MAQLKELSVTNAELIERLTCMGVGMADLAIVFNISKRTLERRLLENPDLKAHLLKGRMVQKMNIRKKLYDMAVGGNINALKFWITRFDSQDDDVKFKHDPNENDPVYETAEEAEERRISAENFLNTLLNDDVVARLTTPTY